MRQSDAELDHALTTWYLAQVEENDTSGVAQYVLEQEREARWASFIREVLDFVQAEGGGAKGYAAVLRAVGEAAQGQPELFR